ncbi:hypothetical protein [Phenylobacterium sp.]|uniref:hypothetical protein n=1 Tax=Phenylobacterium sp. TaxID=1871053 RepID=UPI00286B1902|nr:hypothetical protein [Phenylobacterium sp.]
MPQDPRSYSPTTPEANRAREQGAGVGQRDLEAQRDANQVDGEARSFDAGSANGDLFDLEDGLAADRPHKSPVDREHGPKTRGRSKQIVSGKPYG